MNIVSIIFLFFVSVISLWISLFINNDTSMMIMKSFNKYNINLVNKNNTFNKIIDDLFYGSDFIIRNKADRLSMFKNMQTINRGSETSFYDGISIFDYTNVSTILMDVNQTRDKYLGAKKYSEKCFNDNMLIFLPNGPEHTNIKNYIIKNVESFNNPNLNNFNYNYDSTEKIIINNLFYTMFNSSLSKINEKNILDYQTYGAMCRQN